MTRGMHPLLRIALLACPAEFRRHCADELSLDLDRRRAQPLPLGITCVNVAWTGLRLHAENIWRDVSYAARILAKAPVFVVVAFLTIALALAANIAAFSILKGMLLDPLPFVHSDRIAFISLTAHGEDHTSIDYPDARDLAARSRAFAEVSVGSNVSGALTGMGRPVELQGWAVGADYFSILGGHAQLGRLLSARDLGTAHIVISDELWHTRFGTAASVLGKRVAIDERTYTVVGVAQPHLDNPGPGFLAQTDYWIAIDPRDYATSWRGHWSFFAIGRLKDGVSWSQAQADASRVAAQLARDYPQFDRHHGLLVRPLLDVLFGPTRTLIFMLYGAALLVLLIAGANLANLLLVRAAARERDLVVRSALGATRKRIASQLAIEAGLVSLAGLAAGVTLAWFLLRAIDRYMQTWLAYGMSFVAPGWSNVRIDGIVLAYAVGITLLFTIVTSTLPVIAHGKNLLGLLNAAGRAVSVARRARLRKALAVLEIVLAFAVLCTAALLVQSLVRLERTPLGFQEAHVYVLAADLPKSRRYRGYAALERFYLRTTDALAAMPGIASAGEALSAGLGSNSTTNYSLTRAIGVGGWPGPDTNVEFNSVTPSYFRTLGIPLLAGRRFSVSDTATAQPVAVISRSFAVQHFGSVPAALDKRVAVGESSGGGFPLRRIVGVVGDVRHDLTAPPAPEVYAPFAQVLFPGVFIVRTVGNDPHLAADATNVLQRIDGDLPPPLVMSLAQLHSLNDAPTRVAAVVFLALAALALLLALAGVYGVVAYGVERRTHEFGIRISLGAGASAIAADVLREAVILCLVGIAIGTVLAAIAARSLTQILYQTSPLDPGTFAAAAAFLLLAVLLATGAPVLRAMKVQPAAALRYE